MTAGQRNCYEVISDYVSRYSLDDVIEAVRAHVDEQRVTASSDERWNALDNISGYILRIQEQLRGMPRR